jgi:hypothetical protein
MRNVSVAGPTRAGAGEISCSMVSVRGEFADLEQEARKEVTTQMHNKRLLHSFGNGRSGRPFGRKVNDI